LYVGKFCVSNDPNSNLTLTVQASLPIKQAQCVLKSSNTLCKFTCCFGKTCIGQIRSNSISRLKTQIFSEVHAQAK